MVKIAHSRKFNETGFCHQIRMASLITMSPFALWPPVAVSVSPLGI
jgi:hypothetical protein